MELTNTQFYPAFNVTYSHFIASFKKQHETFNVEAIRYYLETMRESGRAASTVNLAKCALKAYIMGQTKNLNDRAAIDTAFKEIKTVKPERAIHAEKTLTDSQVKEILLLKKSAKKNALIQFLLTTGARITEALQIRLTDCVVNGPVFITITGKGKKQRRLLITEKLFNEIRKAYNGETWLFENFKGTGPISRQYAHRIVKGTAERMGLKAHPHTFRHTFATRLLTRGKDIQRVSAYLGHSSASITADFYCHNELTIDDINELN